MVPRAKTGVRQRIRKRARMTTRAGATGYWSPAARRDETVELGDVAVEAVQVVEVAGDQLARPFATCLTSGRFPPPRRHDVRT
jgi:hypothetical protein